MLVLAASAGRVHANDPESRDPDAMPPPSVVVGEEKARSGWAALPIGTYAPETQLGLGAFASHFFRVGKVPPRSRPSSVSVVGLYTLRKQLIAELIPEVYWDEQRWHVWSRLDYRVFPTLVWDVGPESPKSSEESYTERRLRWMATVDRALDGPLRVSGKLELIDVRHTQRQDNGLLERGELPGARGGRTLGIGPGVIWDTRDHVLQPHDGALYELSLMAWGEPIGSEYGFGSVILDLRKYFPVTRTQTLALQLYSELQTGEVPFYKLARLGGDDLLRGIFEGRFRDRALLAGQVEHRFPLFWRFSGVAHAALGQVAAKPASLGFSKPVWALGAGARVLLNADEQLNLRADFGISAEGFGFYVNVGEAF